MIRKHENTDSWKAGALAIGVHAALLAAMLISFNWKAAHPVETITEVALWDKLPAPKTVDIPKPEPKPIVEEKPETKPEPRPEPAVEEKPKPEEPKVDIELEKKKKELEQKQVEKQKEEEIKKEKALEQKLDEQRKKDALDKLKQEARDEQLADKKAAEKKNKDALKKLQQDALSEEKGNDDKLASTANASLIGEYTEKIKAKIRSHVNNSLCGEGNPVLKVNIGILPTGQLKSGVRITKSSGNPTCDDAVERAILMSEPFPLPGDAKLKAEFSELNLTIKPND